MNIIDLIKENDLVSDFRIISTKIERYELYFVHEKIETVRAVDTKETNITIYVDHKKYRGESTFTISPSDDETKLRKRILEAIKTASLINNKKYNLVKAETLKGEIDSNFNNYKIESLGEEIFNAIKECTDKSKAQINATEIFISKKIRHIETSTGLNKEEISYDAMIETIPTFDKRKKNDSVELYSQIHFNTFDKETFKAKINQNLKDVISRGKAIKPDYSISCPVLFRSKEIAEILSAIVNELKYQTVYTESNIYKINDKIQTKPLYSTLKIKMLGKANGSSYSHLFDNDGFNLDSKLIVNEGIVKNYYGSNRFAQYLHKKPTGDLNIIELSKGKNSVKSLKEEAYLECVSFSGLQVDLNNDYIGGEVRLANYYDGNKIIPLTGISISGKFSDVINTIKLSNKQVIEDAYKGPSLALVSSMNIF